VAAALLGWVLLATEVEALRILPELAVDCGMAATYSLVTAGFFAGACAFFTAFDCF